MKEIALSGKKGIGKFVLVDDEDFDRLNKYRWCYNGAGYACRGINIGNGKVKPIFMHREIIGTPHGMYTDHIDGNKLNNQRFNIRVCNQSQNSLNRNKQPTNTTGYKGVSIRKTNKYKKFRAHLTAYGKQYDIGCFHTAIEAAKAYDAKARELFGEFARLNFPQP
ncbi:MAG: HNH endonuclease [Candidatus Omnitrophica bacterium]|nr:HNH endonuclease [Candidatus Omnitrophota bacterium]MDD5353531.1 HNH endonuclease [Candidatus Omnitrophota bacterium]